MTPAEAAHEIREAQRRDPDLHRSVQAMVARGGYKDLYEWVENEPDLAVKVAESVKDVDGQIATFEERLAHGDLS